MAFNLCINCGGTVPKKSLLSDICSQRCEKAITGSAKEPCPSCGGGGLIAGGGPWWIPTACLNCPEGQAIYLKEANNDNL